MLEQAPVRKTAGGRPVWVTIVGVCGSGKTELVRRLAERGVEAHTVAQEHSFVPALWRHERVPDVLVYLGALGRTVRRRGKSGMTAAELAEQRRRLADARRHAHLRIRTDRLRPHEVAETVLRYLMTPQTGSYTAFQEGEHGGNAPHDGADGTNLP